MSINLTSLFLKDGDHHSFATQKELANLLKAVCVENGPWALPARNNGRQATHRERFCLRYFLKVNLEKFVFPIEITKSERPDFLIRDGEGVTLGVEHTDAGPEAYQRWLSLSEENNDLAFYPNRHGKATDPGRGGGQMYREARADIMGSWIRKTNSINKQGYQKASSYILISHLRSSAPLFLESDFNEVMSALPDYKCLSSYTRFNTEHPKSFDKVLVILGDDAQFWD
ncbi:MAG: hypothetical protein COB59_09970 [Rhodospirillaceae bacterium]|nr:MAG: hypothetical protein COB59_09970 [Rhodospirillaceae bacterium]